MVVTILMRSSSACLTVVSLFSAMFSEVILAAVLVVHCPFNALLDMGLDFSDFLIHLF